MSSDQWTPNLRYPDPYVTALDPRFNKYRLPLASVERLYTGARWSEGPVWFGDRALPDLERHPQQPHAEVGRGNRRGRACSASRPTTATAIPATGRAGSSPASISRAASPAPRYDGAITVICDRFEGKRLNSPNDIVVKSDGSIWFTDPRFGILGNYEGEMAESGIADERLSRRRQERRGDGGGRRHQCAERACLLARREKALHRGVARRAAHDS